MADYPDMDGTSTDVALLQNGICRLTSEAIVYGYPIKAPMLDIHTVGAGGGSIAYVDSGGLLKVGPRSAGADPGPVCYDRGNTEPTLAMIWILRRIGLSIVLVWIVASIVFLAIRLVPGDPTELLLGQGGVAPDPSAVAELREQLGLDRPIGVQYVDGFRHLLHGDLGQSLQNGSPVGEEIAQRLPRRSI
jgi:hypothetical protein